jgi:radical SAM protein with 4Fe4S-binding SPASM domain
MNGYNALRDIKIISIEFCSICNLHCKYCFLDGRGRQEFLDIFVYEKLIKEVSENKKYNIKVMEWPIGGEFLIYPDFKKVLEITKRYMDKYSNFRPYIILNDNMMLMEEEKIDLILKSGIVKHIICSIDGYDVSSFEAMRPNARFSQVFKNMRSLVKKNNELGRKVFIQVNNGRDVESLSKPFSKEMKEIFAIADDVRFWQPKQWNESFCRDPGCLLPAKGVCTFVFNSVSLSSSGFITKCPMDLKAKTSYSDFRKQTLEEILHSEARRKFITMMFRNKRRLINGCNTCSITNTNNDNRYSNIFQILRRTYYNFSKQANTNMKI